VAAPVGAPLKPGSKQHGFGRRRLIIVGALAVGLLLYLRLRAGSTPAATGVTGTTDPTALPGATDGSLGGSGGGTDLSPLLAAMEGLTSTVSDLQTASDQNAAVAQQAADQAFLAAQSANDAASAASSANSGPALAEAIKTYLAANPPAAPPPASTPTTPPPVATLPPANPKAPSSPAPAPPPPPTPAQVSAAEFAARQAAQKAAGGIHTAGL
jgi:hypothetical protein